MKTRTWWMIWAAGSLLALAPVAWGGGYDFKLIGGSTKMEAVCELHCAAWKAVAYECPKTACTLGIDQYGVGSYDARDKWDALLELRADSATVEFTCGAVFCDVQSGDGVTRSTQTLSKTEKRALILPGKVTIRYR